MRLSIFLLLLNIDTISKRSKCPNIYKNLKTDQIFLVCHQNRQNWERNVNSKKHLKSIWELNKISQFKRKKIQKNKILTEITFMKKLK